MNIVFIVTKAKVTVKHEKDNILRKLQLTIWTT